MVSVGQQTRELETHSLHVSQVVELLPGGLDSNLQVEFYVLMPPLFTPQKTRIRISVL